MNVPSGLIAISFRKLPSNAGVKTAVLQESLARLKRETEDRPPTASKIPILSNFIACTGQANVFCLKDPFEYIIRVELHSPVSEEQELPADAMIRGFFFG